MTKNIPTYLTILLATLLLSGCSKNEKKPPLVSSLVQESIAPPAGLLPSTLLRSQVAVTTKITMNKDAILGRTFLYGASLQFSSLVDGEIETALMAISIGELPATFQIVDDKLRLITDSRMNFESDVNHPERLILEFPILSQDENTLTIQADKASPTLAAVLLDKPEDKKDMPRNSWIRSLEFAEKDELLLIESSIEMANGSLAEFMETLVPREKVVPADFKPYYVDADLNEASERYRFLDAGEIYIDHPENSGERVQTKVAQRFLLKDGEVIKWWVTANIQDEYIPYVKYGVEAWNRYSQAMWKKDIVRFEGKLPEGVKVGDPRYNIIVWDNVQDAGAAYESQGSDPFTGIQTHSLIYLPLAWINIGKEYWNLAKYSEESKTQRQQKLASFLKTKKFFGRSLPVNCFESPVQHLNLASRESPEEFARTLLKGVLFHEMGHALGFAHNFKGSLSFDPDDAASAFSTSIMDYNVYNEEAGAFNGLETADGAILEYDRQLLSVLYNDGKDVKEDDVELPVCADEEADDADGGFDPLCNRYDIGKDPTAQALRAVELLSNAEAKSGRMMSLPKALQTTLSDLPAATEVKTSDQAKAAINKLLAGANGIARIYIGGSANSLTYMSTQAARSLYVTIPDSLPEDYKEADLRENAFQLLKKIAQLTAYPLATKESLAQLKEATKIWLLQTPLFAGLNQDDRNKMLEQFLTGMDKSFMVSEEALLSRLRTRVAEELKYIPTAPLSFHESEGQILDLELFVVNYLESFTSAKNGEKKRALAERSAAAATLATFAKTEAGESSISRLKSSLQVEIRTTTDARTREELRKLLKSLT